MKSLNLIIAQVQAFCQPRQYQGFQLKTVELETLLRLTSAKQKCCDLKHKLNAFSDPNDRNSCQITLLRAHWTARPGPPGCDDKNNCLFTKETEGDEEIKPL